MTRAERPARIALSAVAIYIAVMAGSSRIGRLIVERQAVASGAPESASVMVSPVPLTPLARTVVRDLGARYEFGSLMWTPMPRYTRFDESIATLRADTSTTSASDNAARARQKFLVWARYPFRDELTSGDTVRVRLDDVRYGAPRRPSFASVTVHTEVRRP